MQGHNNMMPQQTWGMNNATMESWIGATADVDNMLDSGFHDFRDPLNVFSSTGYIPQDFQMS